MRQNPSLKLILTAITAASILVACGGGGGDVSPDNTNERSPTVPSEEPPQSDPPQTQPIPSKPTDPNGTPLSDDPSVLKYQIATYKGPIYLMTFTGIGTHTVKASYQTIQDNAGQLEVSTPSSERIIAVASMNGVNFYKFVNIFELIPRDNTTQLYTYKDFVIGGKIGNNHKVVAGSKYANFTPADLAGTYNYLSDNRSYYRETTPDRMGQLVIRTDGTAKLCVYGKILADTCHFNPQAGTEGTDVQSNSKWERDLTLKSIMIDGFTQIVLMDDKDRHYGFLTHIPTNNAETKAFAITSRTQSHGYTLAYAVTAKESGITDINIFNGLWVNVDKPKTQHVTSVMQLSNGSSNLSNHAKTMKINQFASSKYASPILNENGYVFVKSNNDNDAVNYLPINENFMFKSTYFSNEIIFKYTK